MAGQSPDLPYDEEFGVGDLVEQVAAEESARVSVAAVGQMRRHSALVALWPPSQGNRGLSMWEEEGEKNPPSSPLALPGAAAEGATMASEDALPPPMQDAVPLDALPVQPQPQPATDAADSSSRPNAHQQKYDRQLRLWAAAGQSALEHAHVLVVNANATAASTLKNLVLPGPVLSSPPLDADSR